MERETIMNLSARNTALRLAGLVAIGTAGYHGWAGDKILRELEISAADMEFVTGTYQLGTMGWIAGGVLLIGAAGVTDDRARNLIVGVTTVLFGIPAFGTLALTGGEISGGGLALTAVVALALWGRKQPSPTSLPIATKQADKAARVLATGQT